MKIVGCDLHAKQQAIAMVDTETGEFTEKTLVHEGNKVREFYASLEGPVVVGMEARGAMQWFLQLLEELGIECRVGHSAKIRAKETRKQKHDRRDAQLELELLIEDRFPTIWMPSSEQRDLRTLLRDRHQWVKMRTRVQNRLQAIALNRATARARTMEFHWAESTPGLGSVALHESKAGRTAAFVRAVAETGPGTRSTGGRSRQAAPPDAEAAHASGSGADHCIGHRRVPGRCRPVCQWQ